jgi:hypothetical protein
VASRAALTTNLWSSDLDGHSGTHYLEITRQCESAFEAARAFLPDSPIALLFMFSCKSPVAYGDLGIDQRVADPIPRGRARRVAEPRELALNVDQLSARIARGLELVGENAARSVVFEISEDSA